jgi:hypothetical protein
VTWPFPFCWLFSLWGSWISSSSDNWFKIS